MSDHCFNCPVCGKHINTADDLFIGAADRIFCNKDHAFDWMLRRIAELENTVELYSHQLAANRRSGEAVF